MKQYKLSELKENTLYRCVLSNRPVLINKTKIDPGQSNIFGEVYNPVNGRNESEVIYDNMLTDYNTVFSNDLDLDKIKDDLTEHILELIEADTCNKTEKTIIKNRDEVRSYAFNKANDRDYTPRKVINHIGNDIYYTGFMDCYDFLNTF